MKRPQPKASDAATAVPPKNPLDQIWQNTKEWWWGHVTIDVDQPRVIERIEDESDTTGRYIFMTCMSAGIAILGMILSSPAVVIGAMLLSPLMGPILGAGFALTTGDTKWLKESGWSLIVGTIVAVIFCAFIVYFSPLQTVTTEIASRTRPNLFDLLVAFFSGLAGSYAMIRGREGTIVGVAIATALMPPLAAIGFGLATQNWTVFGGALLLYVTNLVTIALTAAIMARLYGFRTRLSERQSMVQNFGIVIAFILLAIPLVYSLRQIAWEANASRVIEGYIEDRFDDRARISQIQIDFGSSPIQVSASVLTPKLEGAAALRSSKSLSKRLNSPIEVTLDQFRVGTGDGEADAAQIAAAKASEQASAAERQIKELGETLALVAGVEPKDVMIDRSNRRAVVEAKLLPGATLATYFELENRVRKLQPDWALLVEPPALPLPEISMSDGKITEEMGPQLKLLVWAARRVDGPIGINGRDTDVEAMLTYLKEQGIDAMRKPSLKAQRGKIVADWLAPDEMLEER